MRNAFAVTAVAVILFTATACSSSSDSDTATGDGSTTSSTTSLSPPTSAPAVPSKAGIEVVLTDYALVPENLAASSGPVVFKVRNDGQAPHNLAIKAQDGKLIGKSKDLDPGQSDEFTVQLASGNFTTFCSIPGHESLGMKGVLKVS